ncbi:MAG: DUF2442 domain-containing protein [Clostridium sp.]|uniref:DUF2442 domain-containing protein n=1 Tax=Clostridia TaxID=186801 RepID=UPI0009E24BFA|nr:MULTISPECIES: DUF2442 domain-containing protein [Clostridia]MBS6764515.1 DUF2442 domain-containing protein [Clostridium sp.]MDU7708761.1 DUF2442 domain-containing protein [Clostridium sp.]
MKVFAIKDEEDKQLKTLAYLIYYEREKKFYIELPENADPWEVPLLLDSFVRRGEFTVNAFWSKLWVQQRIVPQDRQNLGQILKTNGLETYNEYELLMLGEGRCAQDSYYLVPLCSKVLNEQFHMRYQIKIEDVVPLEGSKLLVFFRNGNVRKCNMKRLLSYNARFASIMKNDELFKKVCIQTGGYGVCWGEHLSVSDKKLYETGESIPLSINDFRSFVSSRTVNTTQASELLECTRQNIEDLVKRGKLHPVKVDAKSKLFLKSEIQQRLWR